MKKENPGKALYQQLRRLSCEQLWTEEVPRFERAVGRERLDLASVIRAVGVVFSEQGTPERMATVRQWLRTLLHDPEEKIRRYAMAALPKVGGNEQEERDLIALLEKSSSERERKFLSRTLEKVGGAATLLGTSGGRIDGPALRKVEANVARSENPGGICFDRALSDVAGLRIRLRCRAGLEEILKEELDEHLRAGAPLQLIRVEKCAVLVAPSGPFTLDDIYKLRCFSTASFAPAKAVRSGDEAGDIATTLTQPAMRRLLETFTDGPIRYRLEFLAKGNHTNAIRRVADRAYRLCPTLLNDPRNATWQVNVHPVAAGHARLELTPRLRPDPRFAYRQGDVPAASHPPLAACMARLAGRAGREIVWDLFCGSGLELIERALRGGVDAIYGTDRSAEAISTTGKNLTAAGVASIQTTLACGDFRNFAAVPGLRAGTISLVITNPPMGRRVPIPNLPELIAELFAVAGEVLRPGGRLVFANPVPVQPGGGLLQRVFRRKIDLGGFHCHLEKYIRRSV